MGAQSKVIDDVRGSVMDIALGSLRARKTPMLKVEGLSWILDNNLRPAIIVGYGTDDPEKMSSIHHIIKFHVRKVPIFNVVSAMEDYGVKHTRVATVNVLIYDEKIPEPNIKAARRYLAGQYTSFVVDVAEAFRGRGFEVPTVAEFEVEPAKSSKKKAKVVKKTRAVKPNNKRVRFMIEEDDEDGPVRCLTPTKKRASVEPERADSIMGEPAASPNFTYKDTVDGLTLVVDPDTPMNSVEICHGLGTPVSNDDTTCVPEGNWSFATCTAQNALFEPC
ncbi:hypothetical protein E4T50_00832 [Aureobasidium sp. EXF-12298]|nr:hypothetical protein E4T50_00832 [Aureobasidium sp. EXF-12298]KAI4772434.1 hypothetical protein E4T52_12581 [Aureobasidium sp. EXF-3400]